MFPEESLPKGKGEFILGYYSNNCSSLVGLTEPFQVSFQRGSGGFGLQGGTRVRKGSSAVSIKVAPSALHI